MRWQTMIGLIVAWWVVAPASGFAQSFEDDDETDPAIMSYGLHGFWTGAELGLAAGYLSTGDDYDSDEWRNLAIGAGIGAVSGIGVGLLLGTADYGAGDPPGTGYFIMRNMGYGTTVGALGGAAVGTVMWLADEPGKSIPVGAAIGALAGAGLGLIFGIVEGSSQSEAASADPETEDVDVEVETTQVRFTLATTRGSWLPIPALQAQF